MKQFIKYLELYVQWAALLVAILWVGYVGYTYWLNPYVTTTIKGQVLTPGRVDEYIVDQGEVKHLEDEIASTATPAQLNVPHKLIVSEFDDKVSIRKPGYNVAVLTPFFFGTGNRVMGPTTTQETKFAEAVIPDFNPNAEHPDMDDTVTMWGSVPGLSQVQIPVPAAPAAAGNNPNNPNPGPAAPTYTLKDIGWVTVSGKFNNVAAIAAMNEAKIPVGAQKTAFLRVFLRRQELIGSTWANDQIIKPIPVANMPYYPEPQPGKDQITDETQKLTYWDYAVNGNHTGDICQPVFYIIQSNTQGTVWRTASMLAPATQPISVLPDQRTIDEANRKKAEEDQQKRQQAAARARAAAAAQSGSGSSGGESGGGGSSSGGGSRGGRSGRGSVSGGSAALRNAVTPTVNPSVSPSRPPQRPVTPAVIAPPPLAAAPAVPSAPALPPAAAPQGSFDLTTAGNFEIWAHDVTAEPGHTYRYQLQVIFLNPLFRTKNIAKNPADATVLAARPAVTEWCEPVTVPARSYLFVSGMTPNINGNGSGQASIDVLYFANGMWNSSLSNFSVGDAIVPEHPVLPATGSPSTLDTGWFLVDFPSEPQGTVLFGNADNRMMERSKKKDMDDANYLNLKTYANKTAAAPPPPASPTYAIPAGAPAPAPAGAPAGPREPSGGRASFQHD